MKRPTSRAMQSGSATVSVAVLGVPPSTLAPTEPSLLADTPQHASLVGGTPTGVTGTVALPSREPTGAGAMRIMALSIVVLFGIVLSGCSTFHQQWKQATAQPIPTDDITGPWQGTWKSEVTGHHGTLRCVVTRETPEKYRFLYRATWKKILHGTYAVVEDVRREGKVFKMHGSADLGKLYGGEYEYEGEANPTNFFSTYRAREDHGTFQMTR